MEVEAVRIAGDASQPPRRGFRTGMLDGPPVTSWVLPRIERWRADPRRDLRSAPAQPRPASTRLSTQGTHPAGILRNSPQDGNAELASDLVRRIAGSRQQQARTHRPQ